MRALAHAPMALQATSSPTTSSPPSAPSGPFGAYRETTRRNLRIQEGLRAILMGEDAGPRDPERGEREAT